MCAIESEVMMNHDPIKVYDARWEVHDFSEAEITRLFEATLLYGRELGVDTVTFTRDARSTAGRVMSLGVDCAMSMGLEVYVCPYPISTPQGYFMTLSVAQDHPSVLGMTITASHNPADYVGVKFTVPPVQAIGYDCGPQGGLSRVRALYHSEASPVVSGVGKLHLLDPCRAYIDFSMRHAGVGSGELSGLKVVLDAFNGSAGPELYHALTRAGVTVLARRLVPDGTFPTGSPNPTSQGKMDASVKQASESCCDVVIGVDGDGDRIVFGDSRGILTAGFATLPVLASLGLDGSSEPSPVLYDPKVSPLALAQWGRLPVKPVLFRNGHSQIKDYMTRIGAVAGSEESGHYYHRITMGGITVSIENSVMTILLLLRAIRDDRGLMDRLWSLQEQQYCTGEFNYQYDSDVQRDRAMEAVIDHFVSQGAGTVRATADGIDLQGTVLSRGVRIEPGEVELSDDWYSGYLRIATNEKSVVRSYFTAGSEAVGRGIEQAAREILSSRYSGLVVD